jgi:hypothetical protein
MKRYIFILTIIFLPDYYASAAIINIPADYLTIQAGIGAGCGGGTALVRSGELTLT